MSLVGPPSAEVVALARALVMRRGKAPNAPDPRLAEAVRSVADGLDEDDLGLIARAAGGPADAPARTRLEQALAMRIVIAASALRAGRSQPLQPDEADDDEG